MNFGFTEEQDFLREAVRKFLDGRCPIPEVRTLMETPDAHSPELWSEMASLGWLGLLVPEEHGGAGLTWVDFVVLLEETGRTLLPSPLVSNALAVTALIEAGSPAQQARWLPALSDGSSVGTLAFLEASDVPGPDGIALAASIEDDLHLLDGEKSFVADAGCADLFVVAYRVNGELALALVPASADGVSVTLAPSLDETKRMGTVRFAGVRISSVDRLEAASALATVSHLQDCGAIAVTAEALGAAENATAITVQYAKDRIQFGSPIGRYQGVKHRLSDQWVDTESIKSLLYYGAWSIGNSREELPRYASLAKAYIAEAFTRIGVECVQLHGAVGYTLEYDIQLYIKRSKWVRSMFGDSDYHRDRLVARTAAGPSH
ncbi:MAG: acyl-CoA dehydrogenase [Deltaproteobacteria bacterium]|nr:acyl-CoA dehydrogenase [Deltaproteobacteria bacterium]